MSQTTGLRTHSYFWLQNWKPKKSRREGNTHESQFKQHVVLPLRCFIICSNRRPSSENSNTEQNSRKKHEADATVNVLQINNFIRSLFPCIVHWKSLVRPFTESPCFLRLWRCLENKWNNFRDSSHKATDEQRNDGKPGLNTTKIRSAEYMPSILWCGWFPKFLDRECSDWILSGPKSSDFWKNAWTIASLLAWSSTDQIPILLF